MSHFTCSSCTTPHELFGSSASFEHAAQDLNLDVLGAYITPFIDLLWRADTVIGKLPLVKQVSTGGDAGIPVMVQSGNEGEEVRGTMRDIGGQVWDWLGRRSGAGASERIGTRG